MFLSLCLEVQVFLVPLMLLYSISNGNCRYVNSLIDSHLPRHTNECPLATVPNRQPFTPKSRYISLRATFSCRFQLAQQISRQPYFQHDGAKHPETDPKSIGTLTFIFRLLMIVANSRAVFQSSKFSLSRLHIQSRFVSSNLCQHQSLYHQY